MDQMATSGDLGWWDGAVEVYDGSDLEVQNGNPGYKPCARFIKRLTERYGRRRRDPD
jgi:hypothetical protein